MKEGGFSFRGLEMHGVRMWRSDRLAEAMDFANAHGMTALVLHHNGIIHESTFPKAYFDDTKRSGYAPVRRGQNAIYARQAYLRDLLKQAQRKGLEVWIEVKEIEFSDEVTEKFPQLCKNGIICPTEPVWFEYLYVKTDEFFELYPSVAGIILSPGSPESRAFLSAGKKCNCERCRATDFGDWCYDIIMAIYGSVQAHGKKLAVRDFVYTPDDHEKLARIITRTPDDVIFCIKTSPRDFWPTFPENPMLGRFPDRVQWVEYDTFGQFYGWGVCPSIMLKDLRERLGYARAQGVTGALIRTEWERVDVSAFDHLNKINLIAAAQFTQSLETTDEEIVLRWLREDGWLRGGSEAAVDVAGLTRFLNRTWPIMRKILYVADYAFAASSMFPLDVNNAWYTMLFYHCLSEWDRSAAGRLDLNDQNLARHFAEKDEAQREVRQLLADLDRNDFGLSRAAHSALKREFQFYDICARGFALTTRACLLARALQEGTFEPSRLGELRDEQEKTLAELSGYVAELKTFEETTSHPFYVYMMLNYRNAQGILEQAAEMLRN